MGILENIKAAGMRKMVWALIALIVIGILCATKALEGALFRDCFIALAGFVMGANYGEHKEKNKPAAVAAAPAPEIPK